MKVDILDEPALEFGSGRHIDIRFGIANYFPLDYQSPLSPKGISTGIVGSKDSIESMRQWLDRCRSEIPGKRTNRPNLFPGFPGFSSDSPFQSELVLDDSLCYDISNSDLATIAKISSFDDRVQRAVELFESSIQYVIEKKAPKVVVCALPMQLLEALEDSQPQKTGARVKLSNISKPDFRDMLKAKVMHLRTPIQLVLPATYDPTKKTQLAKLGLRASLQDEATRAWNLHTALYYKAGGVPWRLERLSKDLTVCYIGISFFRNLDRSLVLTSVAQVFNERGEGVVVRGGPAQVSKEDRNVHLLEADAFELLKAALSRYKLEHKTLPARVVIHKSSSYDSGELVGFNKAVDELGISAADFIHITHSTTKLYRNGAYPPMRGTFVEMDDNQSLLYTKGSVSFFRTYPGLYVPNPIAVRYYRADETARFLCRELLSLSKMNWNNSQFDGSLPITLRAARQVADVLRYCASDQVLEPRYAFYM